MFKAFTPNTVRNIVKANGIAHAELCLEEAESQLGRDKCNPARAELDRIMAAAAEAE